ncbi:MAG TPA: GNAT family N-acetyltransferase [Cellulomonas sp.]|uniref:GNAT family N-acetyltransferase n=1 Tax=Cellulomonas sp. TaxID=40001 RepID=UPI002E323261|nr:GNAT family N-acetyltransferase [Cellulomonas sp.]HEX5332823.1 GNAT family N-acetyltransferase [Cellulomonas sp.]
MTDIELLGDDDWEVVRDVRLHALRDSPLAFGSTLAREEGFREQHWRMRLRSSPWWVARRAGPPGSHVIGLVSMISEPGSTSDDRHAVGLWVDPGARREGAGTALLTAVVAAARAEQARTVSLWVAEDNDAALRLYGRLGFEPTGERQPLPSSPGRAESRYELRLD